MPNLISFAIDLRNSQHRDLPAPPNGPLFSKFLPNGREDRIEKPIQEGIIRYWFERRGYQDEKGWIVYDVQKKDGIDPNKIKAQGIIHGGHLFGELQLNEAIPVETLRLVEPNSKPLIAVLKPVVQLIARETKMLLDILRFNFGHYWIIEDVDWDSRIHNMGAHCQRLNLRYFDDPSATWVRIEPQAASTTLRINSVIGQGFDDYLTEENWRKLCALVVNGHLPSKAQQQLIIAFSKLDAKDLERAYIDAVTVLEFAMEKYFDGIKGKSNTIWESLRRVKTLGNKEQLSFIFAGSATVSSEELELALEAIDIRNKIIHEGYKPKFKERSKVEALLRLSSKIVNEPVSKMISHNPGNSLAPYQQ